MSQTIYEYLEEFKIEEDSLEWCFFLGQELWEWCRKHPEMDKDGWPEWWVNGGVISDINCNCFACHENEIRYLDNKGFCCNNQREINGAWCMLDWPGKFCILNSNKGLFDLWTGLDTKFISFLVTFEEDRAALALCIRDLDLSPQAIEKLMTEGG